MRRAAGALLLVASLLPFAAQPALALYAYIHVNTSSDADLADGYCSLREAIIASNTPGGYKDCTGGTTGADRILIDVATVNVTHGVMPGFTAPAVIYSNLGGPRAEIHGDGNYTAFTFTSGADGSSITNLQIDNFAIAINTGGADMTIAANVIGPNSDKGIELGSGGTVTIGGANPRTPSACAGDCNLISGNTNFGIHGDATGVVKGNLIGLDATGTAAVANGHGIDMGGSVTIGGSTADERNVISGNTWWGVGLGGICACSVAGNYIGTNAAGTAAIPNGTGVWVEGLMSNSAGLASTIVIGGTNAVEGNVISGNSAAGIFADKWGQYDSLKIQGNKVGVGAGGGSLGNNGGIVLGNGDTDWVVHVYIGDPYNAAASNEIAYNTGIGVRLSNQFVTADYVLHDSIHDNSGKGVAELNGADDGIAPPVITGVSPVSGTACANCEVDIYSDSADEGKTYEGFTVADGSGNWSFSGTPSGPNVTALALTSARGTSEFSAPVAIVTRQPDGRIKKGSGALIGNNIYNTTGLNQTKSGSKTPGNTIKFGISIQNDGGAGDQFKVTVGGVAVTGYTIKYFHGTTDITAAVVAGTYVTPSLAPGGTWLITAKVKVLSAAAGGSSVNRLITITSSANNAQQDAVKFIVSRI